MTARFAWHLAVVALALGTATCTGSSVDERGPAAYANVPTMDPDLDRFIGGYLRETQLFADDTLEHEVREGRVALRGAVDNEAERKELDRRVRSIPGVKDVDLSEIRIGSD